MDSLKPLPSFQPSSKRPGPSSNRLVFVHNLLRGSMTLPTWLAIGASAQALLLALPIRPTYAVLPALLYLAYVVIDTIAQSTGLKPNEYLPRALQTKFTGVFPDADGVFRKGASRSVCVFVLGITVYHPLGVLAPGTQGMKEHGDAMQAELERDAAQWGLLGQTSFTRTDSHTSKSGIFQIYFFRDKEDVIRFANSDFHRKGWDYYNRITKEHPHIGVMHELYQVPAGEWENIYLNHEPMLSADLKIPVETAKGETSWMSSVVDAKRGKLSTTRGRLG